MNYGDLCPNPMLSLSSPGQDSDINVNLTQAHNGTCEFFSRGNSQVTVVGGIHVLGDNPWSFRSASGCNYAVKVTIPQPNK